MRKKQKPKAATLLPGLAHTNKMARNRNAVVERRRKTREKILLLIILSTVFGYFNLWQIAPFHPHLSVQITSLFAIFIIAMFFQNTASLSSAAGLTFALFIFRLGFAWNSFIISFSFISFFVLIFLPIIKENGDLKFFFLALALFLIFSFITWPQLLIGLGSIVLGILMFYLFCFILFFGFILVAQLLGMRPLAYASELLGF